MGAVFGDAPRSMYIKDPLYRFRKKKRLGALQPLQEAKCFRSYQVSVLFYYVFILIFITPAENPIIHFIS